MMRHTFGNSDDDDEELENLRNLALQPPVVHELSSDEEDEGVEVQEKAARELIATEQAENENVPQEQDKKVDDLADALAKTQIK